MRKKQSRQEVRKSVLQDLGGERRHGVARCAGAGMVTGNRATAFFETCRGECIKQDPSEK